MDRIINHTSDHRLEHLLKALQSAIEGMSEQQMRWHPPGKWCAAEILEHLNLTYTGTRKGFEKVMQAGKPLATRASMTHRGRVLLVVGFGYLPEGRKAPPAALPRGLSPERVRSEIADKIAEMDAIIAECEGRFGARTKLLDHPILGPLTAAEWRKFHVIHGRLHEKQIRRLRQMQSPKG
jgi:DinB superfamily